MGMVDETEYANEYRRDVLDKLDPAKAAEELGSHAVLLCREAPDKFCHRRLVAAWLEEALGIEVPEYVPPIRDVIKAKIFKYDKSQRGDSEQLYALNKPKRDYLIIITELVF
jgi:hypothetical protein